MVHPDEEENTYTCSFSLSLYIYIHTHVYVFLCSRYIVDALYAASARTYGRIFVRTGMDKHARVNKCRLDGVERQLDDSAHGRGYVSFRRVPREARRRKKTRSR